MILKDKKIIFLLPPKTGTTSFIKMFRDNDINFELFPKFNQHSFLIELLKYINIEHLSDYKVYQLCRNPIDRLVSVFYFHKQILKGKDKYGDFIHLDFNNFVELINTNIHFLPHHPTQFCSKVLGDANFKKNQVRRLHGGMRFYIPQTKWNDLDFLSHPKTLLLSDFEKKNFIQSKWKSINLKVKYLKLEDLSKDCSILSEILGITTKLELPKANITKDKTEELYINLYNDKTLKLAQNIYKNDFKTLSYD